MNSTHKRRKSGAQGRGAPQFVMEAKRKKAEIFVSQVWEIGTKTKQELGYVIGKKSHMVGLSCHIFLCS
jgi:hypothetical protein